MEGTGALGQLSWNAGACCGSAQAAGVDDVSTLREIVAWAKNTTTVSSVFLIGHSNGAMMSWRMLCEAGEIFDGVAPIGGGYFGAPPTFRISTDVAVPNGWIEHPTECNMSDYPVRKPARSCWTPKPYHCTSPRQGTAILHMHGSVDTEEPLDFVLTQYDVFARRMLGCSKEKFVMDRGRARWYEYPDCKQRRAALCVVDGMRHTVPTVAADGVDGLDLT